MVAGIVLLALGIKKTIGHVEDPLKPSRRSRSAAAWRSIPVRWSRTAAVPRSRPAPSALVAALACAALIPVVMVVPALAGLAALAAVCAALYAYELVRQPPDSPSRHPDTRPATDAP